MTNEVAKYEQSQKFDLDYFNQICEIAYKSKCYGSIPKETMLNLCITAQDLGISIPQALNGGFWIVQGKIIMSAQLMNNMIRRAGHSIKFGEVTDTSCTLIGKRSDNGDSLTITFNMKMAERAGLLKNPVWKQYPEDMLYANAMKRIGRLLFSDIIGNSYDEYSMHEVIENDKKGRKPDAFDEATIEVENILPKLEQKPESPPIPVESLYLAMDVMGCKCPMESLKEFIFVTAEAHQKSQEFVVQQAMKNDERISKFIESYQNWWRTKNPE